MGCCATGGGCNSLACRVATASYTAQGQGKVHQNLDCEDHHQKFMDAGTNGPMNKTGLNCI